MRLKIDHSTQRLVFDSLALLATCRANGLDPLEILGNEDLSCWLVCEWYLTHIREAGEPDKVLEQMLREIGEDRA